MLYDYGFVLPFARSGAQRIVAALFVIYLLAAYQYAQAQTLATLTAINVNEPVAVYTDLDELTILPDSLISLIEVKDNRKTPIPFQVEHGYHRFIWWLPKKGSIYELKKVNHPVTQPIDVSVKNGNGAIILTNKDKPLLQYNYKVQYPPKGVDTVFKRSGFIHPLWSPSGNILTRISPPDHYHHFGLWNPWTKVLFEGKDVDFWNLSEKQGTVRFSTFLGNEQGPVFAGFRALQKHIVLTDPGGEKTALNEVWDVRAFPVSDKLWICDFTSALSCATDSPVILQEYRYGGFGFRATEQWNDNNSKILTSENKTRKEADATTARWCMIDGDMQKGHSGILFMSYPSNYNYPEPMRVWPEKMNNRGDVFFSFSPTRNKDWPLDTGKSYILKYRMLVYEGSITREQAEAAWKDFAHPPKVIVSYEDKKDAASK